MNNTIILEQQEKLALENLAMKITIAEQNIEILRRDIRNLLKDYSDKYNFAITDITNIDYEKGIVFLQAKEDNKEE